MEVIRITQWLKFALVVAVFLQGWAVPTIGQERSQACASGSLAISSAEATSTLVRGGRRKTSIGVLKVLVVFVRFPDDEAVSPSWPDPEILPDWASHFVDARPDQENRFRRGNLSDFFDRASGGDGLGSLGKLQLIGDVYYIKADRPSTSYFHDEDVHNHVLAKLDSIVDLRAYDNWAFGEDGAHSYVPRNEAMQGGDGYVDHVFMLWRGSSRSHGSGVNGYVPLTAFYVSNDGVRVWNTSGSAQFNYNRWGSFEDNKKGIYIAAHEFSHYLFGSSGGGGNLNVSAHLDGPGVYSGLSNVGNVEWFSLMTANANGTFSAYERYRAGWLDPRIIESTMQSVALEDTHVRNRALLLPVRRDAANNIVEYFLIENFQTTNDDASANPFLPTQIFDEKLRHGLLVYHVENEDLAAPTHSVLDIECADGLWEWALAQGSGTPGDKSDDLISKALPAPGTATSFDERDLISLQVGDTPQSYLALTRESDPRDDRRRYGRNASIGDNGDFFREDETTLFSPWSNPSTQRADGSPSFTGFQVVGYDPGTKTYTLRVACDSASLIALPPAKPQNLRIHAVERAKQVLTWASNSEPDVSRYEILRKIAEVETEFRLIGSVAVNVFEDEVPTGNGTAEDLHVLYCVRAVDSQDLSSDVSEPASIVLPQQPITLSEAPDSPSPQVAMAQNVPNPFNPSTKIAFRLPARSLVSLAVYDLVGRTIETLVDDVLEGGDHEAFFRAQALASGIYVARLQVQPLDGKSQPVVVSRKMSLLK